MLLFVSISRDLALAVSGRAQQNRQEDEEDDTYATIPEHHNEDTANFTKKPKDMENYPHTPQPKTQNEWGIYSSVTNDDAETSEASQAKFARERASTEITMDVNAIYAVVDKTKAKQPVLNRVSDNETVMEENSALYAHFIWVQCRTLRRECIHTTGFTNKIKKGLSQKIPHQSL